MKRHDQWGDPERPASKRQREERHRRRKLGLCRDCGQPAAWITKPDKARPGFTLARRAAQCEKHLEAGKLATRKYRAPFSICSAHMPPNLDPDCPRCQVRIHRDPGACRPGWTARQPEESAAARAARERPDDVPRHPQETCPFAPPPCPYCAIGEP